MSDLLWKVSSRGDMSCLFFLFRLAVEAVVDEGGLSGMRRVDADEPEALSSFFNEGPLPDSVRSFDSRGVFPLKPGGEGVQKSFLFHSIFPPDYFISQCPSLLTPLILSHSCLTHFNENADKS